MTPTTATPIQTQFLQTMVAHGWRTDRLRVDAALKDYDTAAGGRTAVVYCRRNSDGDHVLTGDYQSEGRNALSTCWAMFRPGTSQSTIASEIERFAADAEETISQTYAMRIKALLEDADEDSAITEAPRA